MITNKSGIGRPDVSVLMTAYNSEEFLAEALESIATQETSLTWELLFVDDGSSDRTLHIANDFADRFAGRVRVLHHPDRENRGISASRNLALRHASGEFLAFLDSDDCWLPCHLELQVTILRSMPAVAMVYAGAERWFDFSLPFREQIARTAAWGSNCLPQLLPAGQQSGLLPRGALLSWFREDESLVPCICTVILRTATAREVGGFCEEFRGLYDDQAFHAKVVLQHDVYANDICTARYRQHDASCCHREGRTREVRAAEEHRFQHFLQSYLSLKASQSMS